MYFADSRTIQYMGKLTYLINQDHNVSFSLNGTPSTTGGLGTLQLDPRTGLPAEPVWRTVSVAAASCADANTAATAAVIRGRQAPAWLASLNLPARLIEQDGTVLTVAGWPADQG